MALLTQAAVESQLDLSSDLLNNIEQKYNISTMKNELQAQLNSLKNKERVFLNIMGVTNIDELNRRLKDLKQDLPGLQNLSGSNLNKVFLQPTRYARENQTGEYKQKFINYFLYQEGYGDFLTPKDFGDWFLGILNEGHKGTPFSARSGFIDATSLEQVIISKLSEAQQKRVKGFLGLEESVNLGATIQTTTTTDTLTHTLNYKEGWAGVTGFTKGADIQAMLQKGTLKQEWLMEIIGNLENYIISNVSTVSESALFNSVVHEVLYEPSSLTKIFYGGNMVNGITGLLGEIQGLYIIKKLMGSGADRFVNWTGGIKNPHEDLVMSIFSNGIFEKIGVQIKNSAKDIEKIGQLADVSFTKKSGINITDIKNRLGSDYEDIIKIYEMDAFNVEYMPVTDEKGRKFYKAMDNDKFKGTRQRIEQLSDRADRTMALFAGSLMYMSISINATESLGGNCVFLLGGSVFQLASQILTNLFKQLEKEEEELSFKVTSYFERGSNGIGTIVDYLNSKEARKGSASLARGNVILESAYTFSI